MVLPEGWQQTGRTEWTHDDGSKAMANPGKPDGIIALANAIPGMGAISTVIVNTFPLPIQDIKSKAELDFSGKELRVEDIIIIAALIPSNVSHTYIYLLLSLISLSVTRGR
jgi:hypothetical protein